MDGFYVAKFKVGKPAKKAILGEASTNNGHVEELEGVSDLEGEDGKAENMTFNDEEDAKMIEAEKIKALKRKGIKVIPKEKRIKPSGPAKFNNQRKGKK